MTRLSSLAAAPCETGGISIRWTSRISVGTGLKAAVAVGRHGRTAGTRGANLPSGIQVGANVLARVWPVEGGLLTAVGDREPRRRGGVTASAAETDPRAWRDNRVRRQGRTPLLQHVRHQQLALLSLHGGRRARTNTTQGGGADVQRAFVLLLVQ